MIQIKARRGVDVRSQPRTVSRSVRFTDRRGAGATDARSDGEEPVRRAPGPPHLGARQLPCRGIAVDT